MAIRIDGASECILRSGAAAPSGAPTSSAYTVCLWFYKTANAVAGLAVRVSNSAGTVYRAVSDNGSGQYLSEDNIGLGTAGATVSNDAWHHLAWVVNGDTSSLFIDGAAYGTDRTQAIAADSGNQAMLVGGNTAAANTNLKFANVKIWEAALSLAEIQQEMATLLPQRYSNIWNWSPNFSGATERLLDYSGNARNWTASGTLSDEDPPPVSWGAEEDWLRPVINSGAGSASGTGTATGVGASTAASTAAASATGTATGIGASTAASDGAAAGTGTATGVGASTAASDGAASGTGTAAATGLAIFAGDGAAAGTGTATGVGSSTAASDGAAAGTGTATGVGSSTAASDGAAAGTGTAAGIGASTAEAVGSAAGTGTATGASEGTIEGVGAASGTGTATGVGASTAAATGSASGTGTVAAVGVDASAGSAFNLPPHGHFLASVGALKVLVGMESSASYPDVVVTLSLQDVYDQAPSRSNEKGNRITSGLKTPAANASDLPGGAGTVSGATINVPTGTTNYSGWDMSGYAMVFGAGTYNATFTDCTHHVTGTGASGILFYMPDGTITLTINWCTLDGADHDLDFGSIYMSGAVSVDLTMTNCYYVSEPIVAFIRAGTTVGSDVITDNYFGVLNQGGLAGQHCEYHHDISSASGTRSVTVQRNFFDGRNRTGAADTITGYLRPENTGGTVDWLVEDNIFIGFGDPSTSNFTSSWAFQLGGLGTCTFNRNAIQNHDHPTTGYFTVASGTLTGTGNRRWGADGSLDTLIVEGGVS